MGLHLEKFVQSKTGTTLMSIILGIGLASLFRVVCKGKECIYFKAPPLDQITNKIFKHEDKCYKYVAVSTKCNNTKKIINI
jgi:hypothetical protein